jgi:ribosome-associated protein
MHADPLSPSQDPAIAPSGPSPFDEEIERDNSPATWRLDHFLKYAGIADTGGQAKLMIQSGQVRVNGEVETRRRRKLSAGDTVQVAGQSFSLGDSATET